MNDERNNGSQRLAIVGGGMLGMTLAHRLAQHGHHVTLLEAADHLGGMADAWELGDVTWDRHYHVTLLSDTYLRQLLVELDLDQDMQWVETKTGFFTDGVLHSMSNTWEFLRFPPLNLLDKLRLGATIFYASKIKNWQRLEAIPVADWLRACSGRRTFNRIWQPLLRAKLGDNYRATSAAFIWATIARMYAARRTGLKKEMFGYLPGGYARLLRRFGDLLREEGVDIRLGHAVREVRTTAGGQVSISCDAGTSEDFQRVVLTTPCSHVDRLCPQLTDDERQRFRGVKYQGIVCASLLLKRSLSNFYVTNITEAGLPFTAVIEMSALVDPRQFDGRTLVYLPKYVTAEDPAAGMSDEELRAQFLTGLEQMYPHFRRDDVLAFRVSRVRNVMAIPTLHYSGNVPPLKTSLPGVYAVNSAQIVNGTLNVNETVKLAEEALEQIQLPLDQPTQPLIPMPTSDVETNCQLVTRS